MMPIGFVILVWGVRYLLVSAVLTIVFSRDGERLLPQTESEGEAYHIEPRSPLHI